MKKHLTKLVTSSKSDEYGTPDWILDFAREVMGVDRFDFDPATMPHNPTNAKNFFTIDDDALNQDWGSVGSLWMNPPFSNSADFVNTAINYYMTDDIDQMIILCKSDARNKSWHRPLMLECDYQVVINSGVKFVGAKHTATFGVLLYTFGVNAHRLKRVCKSDDRFLLFQRA